MWTITGCRYYVCNASVGDRVVIKKHAIDGHPWNIAAFTFAGKQVGTLTATRIKKVFPNFLEDGLEAKVVRVVYGPAGSISQLKVKVDI